MFGRVRGFLGSNNAGRNSAIALIMSGAATAFTLAATVGAAWYTRSQASSATETLRRSDEELTILADVNRDNHATVRFDSSDDYSSFQIRFSGSAVIINTGGSPAVITDSVVETYNAEGSHESRIDIFDPTTEAPWPKFAVIRPNEPQRLNLTGSLSGSSRSSPAETKALMTLFTAPDHQNGTQQRQFSSLNALRQEIRSHADKTAASDFEKFLWGSGATTQGPLSADPWSEKGETQFSRIILRVSTVARRTYRSSPGLLAFGPNPGYSIDRGLISHGR